MNELLRILVCAIRGHDPMRLGLTAYFVCARRGCTGVGLITRDRPMAEPRERHIA